MVLGYAGEPYLRVGPAGVFENRRSPATYLNRARVNPAPPPLDASADAPPSWRRIGEGDTVTWHDHPRPLDGGQRPASGQGCPNRPQVVVPGWQAELRVGSQPVRVSGDLRWIPGPALAVAGHRRRLAAAGPGRGRQRRWPQLLAVLTGLLIAVDVVHTVGIWNGTSASAAAKAYASLGSWAGWALGTLAIHRLLGPHPRRASIYLLLGALPAAEHGWDR